MLSAEKIDAIAHEQDEAGEPAWFTAQITKLEWRNFARAIERAVLESSQPVGPVGQEDERASFEAHVKTRPDFEPHLLYRRDMRGSDRFDQYVNPAIEAGWTFWQARAAQPVPPAGGEPLDVPADILDIMERLHTQDNRITESPLFAVQQKRRIYGVDPDRCDAIVWLDEENDYREATEEEFKQMEASHDNGDDGPSNWYRTGYLDTWEFVTGCFTEQGCKDFIARNGHNMKEPRIYAYGSYRNAEFIAIRKWLMSLRRARLLALDSAAPGAVK